MAFTWSKDLETGNLEIDQQHKKLIEAINSLMEACGKGEARAQIKETAAFLLDYTSKHFKDEEKLQVASKYPDYINHKRYHDEFVKVVKGIVKELEEQGPTIALIGKVNNAIGGWLINHIKREDVKIAQHIKSAK